MDAMTHGGMIMNHAEPQIVEVEVERIVKVEDKEQVAMME